MSTPLTITHIESSAKGGLSATLGRLTLFLGDNGSGKSAYTQAVELAAGMGASDITGRGLVSAPHMLMALAPDGEPLYAKMRFSDGQEAHWRTENGKEPEGVCPHPVTFPIRDVIENLTGSADKAREFLLHRAALTVSRADVLKRLGGMVEAYETASASYAGSETTILQKVLDRAEKDARDRLKEAKTIRSMGASLSNGLGPEPTEAQIEEAQQEVAIAQRAWETAVQDKAGRISEARLAEMRQIATALVEQFNEAKAALGAEVAPLSPEVTARLTLMQRLVETCALHEGASECLVCGGPAGPAVERGRAYAKAIEGATARNQARRDYEWRLNNLATARARAEAEIKALQAAEAAGIYDGIEPSEAHARMVAAQADLQALLSTNQKYESIRATEVQARTADEAAETAKKLAAACSDAVAGLLATAVESLQAKVQSYLPAADTFVLRLKEGQKDVCKFGFLRNGKLHTALSGAEWARVLVAIACAISEGKPGLQVFIPPDRAFDPDTLRAVMVALAKAPGQVLFCSPVRPSGKLPAGWTLVEVGAPTKAAPRKKAVPVVEPELSLPDQGAPPDEEDPGPGADDPLAETARGLHDGTYTIRDGTISYEGNTPVIAGSPLQDGELIVENHTVVSFVAAPVAKPAAAPDSEIAYRGALAEYGWSKAQVDKMNPNARRVAALEGLDPKGFSVVKDGSLFDVVKGVMLAPTTPNAKITPRE